MIEPLAELVFGRQGNAAPCLLDGWAAPEDGFTWTIGRESRLQFAIPPVSPGHEAILELDLTPFSPPGSAGQRIAVLVNGVRIGADLIRGEGTVGYRIPDNALGASGMALVELQHPDGKRPIDFGLNVDARLLGFMLRSAVVLPVPIPPPFEHRVLQPLDFPLGGDGEAARQMLAERMGRSAGELLLEFESLGHNCEFGVMQRHCGVEPLGLLRFVAITLPDLLRGLDCGFAGAGDERSLQVMLHPGPRPEFLVWDTQHNISFHSFRYEDETTADQVRAEQGRQLRFFHRQFTEVLETGERLFVFQRPGQTTLAHMLPLLTQLRSYGPNALLFVTEAMGHPPGTVVQVGHGLYHGHIGHLAPGEDVGRSDQRGWLSICANAYTLWREQMGQP